MLHDDLRAPEELVAIDRSALVKGNTLGNHIADDVRFRLEAIDTAAQGSVPVAKRKARDQGAAALSVDEAHDGILGVAVDRRDFRTLYALKRYILPFEIEVLHVSSRRHQDMVAGKRSIDGILDRWVLARDQESVCKTEDRIKEHYNKNESDSHGILLCNVLKTICLVQFV